MKIQIVAPQPGWKDEFRQIAAQLRAALGELALRIDHIGSTSVPDLPAKDRIDIQVTVARLEPAVQSAMNGAGFSRVHHISCDHVPPGASADPAQWEKWLYNEIPGQRPANIHIRVYGRANQRYPILFRDFLRSHPEAAQAYAQVKQALARLHPDDSQAYYDVKDPVCDIIMSGAEIWAKTSKWSPAASDA